MCAYSSKCTYMYIEKDALPQGKKICNGKACCLH